MQLVRYRHHRTVTVSTSQPNGVNLRIQFAARLSNSALSRIARATRRSSSRGSSSARDAQRSQAGYPRLRVVAGSPQYAQVFIQSPHTQLLVGQHCVNHLVEYRPVRPSCLITSPRAEPSGHRSDDISRKSKMPIPAKSSNGAWDNVTGLRVARIGSCAELLISAARLLRPGGAPS